MVNVESVGTIETLFKTYPFAKECVLMYRHGTGGIMDFKVIDEADSNTLNGLKELTSDVQKLNNGLTESLEKLISPGISAKVKRKCRKPVMFVEDCHAIWVVHRKDYKKKVGL